MFKEEKQEIQMSKELVELNSIEIIKNMLIDYDKNFEYYGNFPSLNLERKKAIETVLNLLEKKDEEIDKMAEQLAGLTIFDIDKDEPLILGDKEEIKQYFERKVENGN
ncbi:MAG: hypothetical protein ACI4UU_00630 [Clostridia bacterium]